MSSKRSRRSFLKAAGVGTVTLANLVNRAFDVLGQKVGQEEIIEIQITNLYKTGRWYFDPVGVYLIPGQKVRWVCRKWGGSATAFHPSNGTHELRIPEGAHPFDSGMLADRDSPNAKFEWVFEREGTYDYFSRRHERLGAVGRIVVGSPGGPGEKPLGYGASRGMAPIFEDVKKLFSWLSSEKIVRQKVVPYPMDLLERGFPLQESHF